MMKPSHDRDDIRAANAQSRAKARAMIETLKASLPSSSVDGLADYFIFSACDTFDLTSFYMGFELGKDPFEVLESAIGQWCPNHTIYKAGQPYQAPLGLSRALCSLLVEVGPERGRKVRVGLSGHRSSINGICMIGDPDALLLAISMDSDILGIVLKKADDDGSLSPLSLAAAYGHYELCSMLLEMGHPVDMCSNFDPNQDALGTAFRNNHPKVCALLAARGSGLGIIDRPYFSKGDPQCVKAVLAEKERRDLDGSTWTPGSKAKLSL